jgi:hypothetical protein
MNYWRALRTALWLLVLTFVAVATLGVAAHAHTVPGDGTKYTVTVATTIDGDTGSTVSSGYRVGSRTSSQRSDYVTAGQNAVGAGWLFQSVRNCGRTTCNVKFLLPDPDGFPATTWVSVIRYRHNHTWTPQ